MKYKFYYGRVSTVEQNEERQTQEAARLGIDERLVFIDKSTGKNFDRPQYQAMVSMLREGDEVYISSLDRLGRNYKETAENWEHITKNIKANIIVMDMPVLDTRNNNDLTAQLVQDIVLKLLCYVAEKEWDNMKSRQKAGIAAARARGVYTGRKPKMVDTSLFEKLCGEVDSGQRTARSACKRLDISSTTFYKLRKEMKSGTGRWENGDEKQH